MRLTADLINNSLSYLNPLKERELDLRGNSLPNLTTLVLSNNNVGELGDLEGLSSCTKLTHLVLNNNPITRKEHYRLYVIWSLPSLRFLDYAKIRELERDQAIELFGTIDEPTELAAKLRGNKSRTFEAGKVNGQTSTGGRTFRAVVRVGKKRVQELPTEREEYAEIDRIEKDLAEGRVPHGVADADRMVSVNSVPSDKEYYNEEHQLSEFDGTERTCSTN